MTWNNLLLKLTRSGRDVVSGESLLFGHEGEIEVDSLSFEVGTADDRSLEDVLKSLQARDAEELEALKARRVKPLQDGRTSLTKPTFKSVKISKRFDSSSGALWTALRTQTKFSDAVFCSFRRVEDSDKLKTVPLLTITLKAVTVQAIDLKMADQDRMLTVSEDIVLDYEKISVAYSPKSGTFSFDHVLPAF